MEDHNHTRNQSESSNEEEIFELSADMELSDQTKHKIIDLTDEVDSSAKQTKDPSEEDKTENKSTTADTEDATPSQDGGANMPETITAESTAQGTIENQVDAAFDAVAEPSPKPMTDTSDDRLFNELTDITQKVDDAVGQPATSEATEELPPTPLLDDEAMAAAVADIDAAMAGEQYDDNTFGQTDEAKPSGAKMADAINKIYDDEVIELVDIVDPAEVDRSAAGDQEDDEIIELTDIVDPAELESLSLDGDGSEKEDEPETTGPSEAIEPCEETETTRKDEVLTLSDRDDDIDLLGDFDNADDQNDIISDELDDLFDGDEDFEEVTLVTTETVPDDTLVEPAPFLEEETIQTDTMELLDDEAFSEEEVPEPTETIAENIAVDSMPTLEDKGEQHEQVIQLSDILKASKADRAPTEQVKMEAQEDMAEQPIASEPDLHSETDDDLLVDKNIEAAVEHIIQTKYAHTIEQMIASAVEKAVMREIENIRRTLSDDDGPL